MAVKLKNTHLICKYTKVAAMCVVRDILVINRLRQTLSLLQKDSKDLYNKAKSVILDGGTFNKLMMLRLMNF